MNNKDEVIKQVIKGELNYSPESYGGAHNSNPVKQEVQEPPKEQPKKEKPLKG